MVDSEKGRVLMWDPRAGMPHIGIVVNRKSPSSGNYLIVHNLKAGPKMEDALFRWKITGRTAISGPLSGADRESGGAVTWLKP